MIVNRNVLRASLKYQGKQKWKEKRNIKFWKKIREVILFRDNYSCKVCNNKESKLLCVHHIDLDKDNNCLENLVVLCASCHMALHKGFNADYRVFKMNDVELRFYNFLQGNSKIKKFLGLRAKLYRFFHKFTPKLVRCPNCEKRFFLAHIIWSYDAYLSQNSNGIHSTYCKSCSKKNHPVQDKKLKK